MTSRSTGRIFSCASSSVLARVVILSRTLPWPASGATVGSSALRKSWTFSASADSPMPAKWSVLETMEPSLRARIRGSSVSPNKLRSLGEQRLLVVVLSGLAAEPFEHLVHVFAGFGVLDHLAARQGREAGVREVVRGRAQAARGYNQGGAGGGFA